MAWPWREPRTGLRSLRGPCCLRSCRGRGDRDRGAGFRRFIRSSGPSWSMSCPRRRQATRRQPWSDCLPLSGPARLRGGGQMQREHGLGPLSRWRWLEPRGISGRSIRRRRSDLETAVGGAILRHQGAVHDRLLLRAVDDRRKEERLLRRMVPGLRPRHRLPDGDSRRRQTLPPLRHPQADGFSRHKHPRRCRRRHDYREEPASLRPAHSHGHAPHRLRLAGRGYAACAGVGESPTLSCPRRRTRAARRHSQAVPVATAFRR